MEEAAYSFRASWCCERHSHSLSDEPRARGCGTSIRHHRSARHRMVKARPVLVFSRCHIRALVLSQAIQVSLERISVEKKETSISPTQTRENTEITQRISNLKSQILNFKT